MKLEFYHGWLPFASLSLLFVAMPSAAEQHWEGNIGAGALYAPDYLGSDDYETQAWPALSLSYSDRFYFNLRDGLGWNAVRQGNWRVSPFIGYTLGREDDDDLKRLDEVDGGATAGLRVAYINDAWAYSAAAQAPFSGDIDGYQLALKARWSGQLSERWSAAFGPGLTYSNEDWTEDMFGISLRESARSGLSAYDPNEGYFRFSLGGSLSYWLTPDWSITGMAGVSQLTGNAKDSPIVDDIGDATQAYAGAFIRYRF